jgi:molybdopterin/thiamine biosynthesis adenylyltransferase/rhodanese-related sulfurtransferase
MEGLGRNIQLSEAEQRRYSRHLLLADVGTEGQLKLKNARVLVIGAGGLGCPVLLYLAAAGVGTLGIVDADVVEESNLQRQVLYGMNDVGTAKTTAAVRRLAALNPHVQYREYSVRITAENALDILSDFDIIVDGSDNFPTRYLLNDACVILGKPLVFGSIFTFEGQVSVFNYENGPTYRCLYPEPPAPGEVPSCSEAGVLGVLPGMIGSLQANEVIKMITGIGEVLSGTLFLFDALTLSTTLLSVRRNPDVAAITALVDYEEFCGVQPPAVRTMSVQELHDRLVRRENICIIDVREPHEYAICNLGGILLPLGELESRIHEIPEADMVVVHCHKGTRSAQAVHLLSKRYGLSNAVSLEGGIAQWALDIENTMQRY